MRAARADPKETIRLLLRRSGDVSSGKVAEATGLTRQAALYHLTQMVRSGEVERRGAGRAARYVSLVDLARRYRLEGLAEDRVWDEVAGSSPGIARARPNVRSILNYAFTEMLNNAIEHSGGTAVDVRLWAGGPGIAFEIVDDGVGVFRHLREGLGLEDDFAAIQELSKGKRTTDPERHTGEGIFFTSKAVERFELDSGGLRWVVDNARGDQAAGEVPPFPGTRVRCEIDKATHRTMQQFFAPFTDQEGLAFDRSSVVVRLFERPGTFVSRSEARRIASGLERFREVRLDFTGVSEVGQGFVDELFRVWAREHPETKLVAVNMAPAVEMMVRRGLPPPPGDRPRG